MPRARDPNRDKAFEVWKEHEGNIANRALAEMLGVPEKTIGGWKSKDKWKDKLNRVLQTNERSTPKEKRSKPKRTKEKKKKNEEVIVESDELTDKQRLFVGFYVKYWNATKAYQKAYECAYSTALTNGPALLGNTRIRDEVVRARNAITENALLDKRTLIQKWIDIAFADMTDFIDFTQVEAEATETEVEYNPDGSKKSEKTEVVPYTYTKFAMHHSDEVDGTLITEISKGKDGMFKVKLADKVKALEYLSKHMDLLNDNELKKLKEEKMKADIAKAKAETEKLTSGEDDKPIEILIKRKG